MADFFPIDDDDEDEKWYASMEKDLKARINRLKLKGMMGSELVFLQEMFSKHQQRRADSWMQGQTRKLKTRLQLLRADVRTECKATGEWTDFEFTTEHIILMTARPNVKESLLKGLKAHATNVRSLRFDFAARGGPPESLELPDTNKLFINATALGQTLNSLPSLETVVVVVEGCPNASRSILLASVVLACHNARRFIYRPGEEEEDEQPENFEIFISFIQGHPNLEHVKHGYLSENVPEPIRNTLLGTLPSLPKLKSVDLYGSRTLSGGLDDEVFRDMLQIKTLTTVILRHFEFEEGSVDSVCSALAAASHLKHLTVEDWYFPDEFGPPLAQALTSMKIVELSCNGDSCSRAFFDALGRGVAEHAGSPLKILHIWNPYHEEDDYTESLVSLFQHAADWEIQCLHLDLNNVTLSDDFALFFSLFIANNKHLQQLFLRGCKYFNHGLQMIKNPVLEAFSSGVGSLDVLEIVDVGNQPSDAEWASTLKKHVASNLNRHRRLSGAMFQRACKLKGAASRQCSLLKALASVDDSARFAFLSANEWRCRDALLMILPQSPSTGEHINAQLGKKRKRKGSAKAKA